MQSRGAYMALSILTGLLMIVLGGLFLAQPGLSLASIIWLVGIFAIVYGLFLVIAGIVGRHDGGGWAIAGGVLAVIMGIVVLAWPAATSLAVLYIIAAWAIFSTRAMPDRRALPAAVEATIRRSRSRGSATSVARLASIIAT